MSYGTLSCINHKTLVCFRSLNLLLESNSMWTWFKLFCIWGRKKGGKDISSRCCLKFHFWVFKEYSFANHKKLSSKHLNACFDACDFVTFNIIGWCESINAWQPTSCRMWLPRWNQILIQLNFIHNWFIIGIQWMVC